LQTEAACAISDRPVPARGPARAVPVALALAFLLWHASATGADGATTPTLLVHWRSSPPEEMRPQAARRGADGSWSVSTSGATGASYSAGNNPEAARPDPGNEMVLATREGERVVRLREGEAVLIDLPAVQSLQFRRALPAAGGSGGASAGTSASPSAGTGSAAAGSTAAGSAGNSASGVVYFESVAAFTARFHIAGQRVRIELVPRLSGTVRAPVPGAGEGSGSVTVEGPLGNWIALGGGAGASDRGLSAAPPTQDAVWLRVEVERGGDAGAARR